jgi:uncharacterized protein (TIGR03083 family)
MDVADVYDTTRSHLFDLAATLDDAQAQVEVPATPGWTIKDSYAHLAGLCADILDDRMEGAGTPAANARQIAERADKTLTEIVAEWAERSPDIDAWIADREDPPMFLAYDAWTHEQDVLGALGEHGERSDERVQDLAAAALAAFNDRFLAESAPPLRVVGDEVETTLGEGEATVTLNIDDYELMRMLFGRRSRQQIEAADWDGDEGPFIDFLHLFPLPAHDLID